MKNILVISETSSYLIATLEAKFKEAGFGVESSHAEPDELSTKAKELCAVFIFADDNMVDKHKGLIYIKDKAVEEDLPVFVTGDTNEINMVAADIPKHLIQAQFERPLNVNETAMYITKYLNEYGKHNKKKILLVDDSGAMLRNVKGWLGEKYQVILANSGAMAIKYLAMNRPDLVLLDYEMPVIDGRQVLEMIRSEHEFEDIPVIFLTSKGDKESVMQVMSLKPEGYLLKTMPPQQIVQTVDDFFERRKALKK